MNQYIEIISYNSQQIIKRLDVSDCAERQIDKIDSGLNINLNHEQYFTRTTNSEVKLEIGNFNN